MASSGVSEVSVMDEIATASSTSFPAEASMNGLDIVVVEPMKLMREIVTAAAVEVMERNEAAVDVMVLFEVYAPADESAVPESVKANDFEMLVPDVSATCNPDMNCTQFAAVTVAVRVIA